MSNLSHEEIRERLMNRKRRMTKLEIELPDLEDLNGQLALQELSMGDFDDAEKQSMDKDGNEDPLLENGVLIARSLVRYATKKRLLEDEDAEWIKREWGSSVSGVLLCAVREFSGKTEQAYENAKKNYLTRSAASATSSESNSGVPGQDAK